MAMYRYLVFMRQNFINKYFYTLTNSFEAYDGRFDINDTLVALKLSKQVLNFPMYGDLPLSEAERIAIIVKSCKR